MFLRRRKTKKATKILAIALVAAAALTACATKPAPAVADELDIAIREASDYLNSTVPAGSLREDNRGIETTEFQEDQGLFVQVL
jgi:ABC-type oligopeptide transport system substrate-binding subunit